jgi:hypothetical protein
MLRFRLDQAEGSDVVGTLTIGNVSPIEVEGAYLDGWVAGLLEGLGAVKAGATRCEIDLVEEPKPLFVSSAEGDLSMRFGDQMTTIGSIEPAIAGMLGAVGELVQMYPIRNEALAREIESKLGALTRRRCER